MATGQRANLSDLTANAMILSLVREICHHLHHHHKAKAGLAGRIVGPGYILGCSQHLAQLGLDIVTGGPD